MPDVLERYSFGFYELILRAQQLRSEVNSFGNSQLLFKDQRAQFPSLLAQLKMECAAFGLSNTLALATYVEERHVQKGDKYVYTELLSDLDSVIFAFGDELRREVFVRVPADKETFFQQDALFGPEVAKAFPSSANDIQHAGTCFALGQDDACVFHAMRVLEAGLTVIAGEVSVDPNKNWANVIDQIEAALKKEATGPRVDTNRRRVMAQAAVHLYWVKDAWRNDVMHAQARYDTGTAHSVLTGVGNFMRGLAAAGLSEPPDPA